MKDRSVWRCQECGFASPKPDLPRLQARLR